MVDPGYQKKETSESAKTAVAPTTETTTADITYETPAITTETTTEKITTNQPPSPTPPKKNQTENGEKGQQGGTA